MEDDGGTQGQEGGSFPRLTATQEAAIDELLGLAASGEIDLVEIVARARGEGPPPTRPVENPPTMGEPPLVVHAEYPGDESVRIRVPALNDDRGLLRGRQVAPPNLAASTP